jgi:hypothetical protein
MSALTVDLTFPEGERNRLTVGLRMFTAIPHLLVAQAWGTLAEVLAVVQWVIVLFTGKRDAGIFEIQQMWIGYQARALSYAWMLHDVFPPFAIEPGAVPARTDITMDAEANRLTAGLRVLWVIPAAVFAALLTIAAFVVMVISWFAVLFTGRQSRGMWEFVAKALRYVLRTQAYGYLMTDTYPRYE